jgi:hypothetical protein
MQAEAGSFLQDEDGENPDLDEAYRSYGILPPLDRWRHPSRGEARVHAEPR